MALYFLHLHEGETVIEDSRDENALRPTRPCESQLPMPAT